MADSHKGRSHVFLPLLATFAFGLALLRAYSQSIMIDEAYSYVVFVASPHYLRAGSNNHILNTVLMAGFTDWFGISEITVRLPALIGAAMYISAVYSFCRMLKGGLLQCVIFICLTFNPFVLDYLIAARGYSLALACLTWAVVYSASWHFYRRDQSLVLNCALCSALLGLSFSANLSFAFIDLTIAICIFLAAAEFSRWQRARVLLLATTVPGVVIALAFTGYALAHWPSGELIFGAQSLSETFSSVVEASLYQPRWNLFGQVVFPLVALAAAGSLGFQLLSSRQRTTDADPGLVKLKRFGLALLIATVGALSIHWVVFQTNGLLLPKDRTAIYLFSLPLMAVGVLASLPHPSRVGRFLKSGVLMSLILMAVHFILCLRIGYFKEWQWDENVKEAQSIISCIGRDHGVTKVASSWSYLVPLEFYRIAEGSGPEMVEEPSAPPGVEIFVIDTFHTPGIVESRRLDIVYEGRSTDLVIAAPPVLATSFRAGQCLVAGRP